MAYYKLQMDIWCDWDPEESDFGDIAQNISSGGAICTRRKVIAVVDRPQDIEDEAETLRRGRGRRRSEPGIGLCFLTRVPRRREKPALEGRPHPRVLTTRRLGD